MSMGTMHKCRKCDCELTLDCGEFVVVEETRGEVLDLTLTCENECGAPVLNAFIPLADFIPIEEPTDADTPADRSSA